MLYIRGLGFRVMGLGLYRFRGFGLGLTFGTLCLGIMRLILYDPSYLMPGNCGPMVLPGRAGLFVFWAI